MSVRTMVLFGALAWVSGSFLVVMHRGVLAEGRVAGVSIAATPPAGLGQASARVPVGDAIVSLSNDKTLYLRRGGEVWRIADTATLQLLAKQVSAREGRSNLEGLKLVGTINSQNMGEILASPALTVQPQEPVGDDDDESGPTAGPLRLRVDSSTPASATLPDGTQLNSVLAIQVRSFSGLPVNLTSLTLTQEYAYLASTSTSTLPTSTTFDGATAWDGATRHGSRGVFGANLRATVDMSADPIVVPPLGTKVVLVKADLPTYVPPRTGDYGVRLVVSAVGDISQTGGTALGAAFPLRGSLFSWVDGSSSIAAAWVDGVSVGGYFNQPGTTTPANLNVGSQGSGIFRFSLTDTNGLEAMVVRQVVVRLSGTVQDGDLVNFRLVPGQTEFPFATATAAVNGVVTFNLPQPYINLPGTNVTFNVYADVASGARRWFRALLVEPSDLTIAGGSSGAAIYPAIFLPVSSPFGYWVIGGTQGSSTVSIESDPTFTHTSILKGSYGSFAANMFVHRVTVTAGDQDVQLRRITYRLNSTRGGSADQWGAAGIESGTLTAFTDPEGAVQYVASTTRASIDGSGNADMVMALNQPLTIPAGQHVYLQLTARTTAVPAVETTMVRFGLKSGSSVDLDIRDASGDPVNPELISLPSDNAVGTWWLNHHNAPFMPLRGSWGSARVMGTNDEQVYSDLWNIAPVPLDLERITFTATAANLQVGTSTNDRVSNFRLYQGRGASATLIANADSPLTLMATGSATTTVGTVSFSALGSVNGGWEAFHVLPVGANVRTLSVRADTSSIRAAGGPAVRTLQLAIDGQTGYQEGNQTSELDWADGDILYGYTPVGYGTARSGFTAADYYPFVGEATSY